MPKNKRKKDKVKSNRRTDDGTLDLLPVAKKQRITKQRMVIKKLDWLDDKLALQLAKKKR